ncbi:MAG: class II fructose-bisphosphate aldolase [Proteobacteria bacterium]|nr:class II fructose-bisphosphate aldolase [Pseudomonadota bacterium]
MQNTLEIIDNATKAGVAVLAFNVPYLAMVEPVIRAVKDQDAFALVETARLEWTKFESQSPQAVLKEFTKWCDPKHVRLHLDHVPVIDEDNIEVNYISIIREAIELGYQSVMVDGSRLDLKQNIAATRKVVELAHNAGIPCEAELGTVLGHESGPSLPYKTIYNSGKGFTDVNETEVFVRETGCDWLSVAIGNVHGAISGAMKDENKVEARLNLEHLQRLSRAAGIPLVLHGGSSVNREDVLAAIKRGIAKINIATEIRQAYESELRMSANVAAAKSAVYEKTCGLIRDDYGLAGVCKLIVD